MTCILENEQKRQEIVPGLRKAVGITPQRSRRCTEAKSSRLPPKAVGLPSMMFFSPEDIANIDLVFSSLGLKYVIFIWLRLMLKYTKLAELPTKGGQQTHPSMTSPLPFGVCKPLPSLFQKFYQGVFLLVSYSPLSLDFTDYPQISPQFPRNPGSQSGFEFPLSKLANCQWFFRFASRSSSDQQIFALRVITSKVCWQSYSGG